MIYSNSLRSSLYDCKSYIDNFIIIHSWVYNKPIQRSAPSWLGSSIGKSVAPVLQRSRARIPYKPEFFSGFLFATAKVASITAMIYFYIIPHPAVHTYDFCLRNWFCAQKESERKTWHCGGIKGHAT